MAERLQPATGRLKRVGAFADFMFLFVQLSCAAVGEVAAFRVIDVGRVESPWLRVAVLLGLIASGIILIVRVLQREARGRRLETWMIRVVLLGAIADALTWTFHYRHHSQKGSRGTLEAAEGWCE